MEIKHLYQRWLFVFVLFSIAAKSLHANSDSTLVIQNIQWIVLNAESGEPYKTFTFVVDGDTLLTDSLGEVKSQSRFPATQTQQILLAKSIIDSLEFTKNEFELNSNNEYPQFVIEVYKRKLNTPKDNANISQNNAPDLLVIARREPLHNRKEVSRIELSRSEMQEVVGVQNDPLMVVRTLPGVTGQNDANQRPYVRGGDWWETRVFWNGIPVLQPFHALSLYSIFNLEGIEDMQFYSGGFPVETSNSLSGAILLRKRQAALDSFELWTQLSMLKGHIWVGAPIIKDKLSVTFAYQSFWYDWVIKRTMGAASTLSGDSEFQEEVDQYQELVDLPNFTDLEFGVNWNITPTLQFDYSLLLAQDDFKILEPEYDDYNSEIPSSSNPMDLMKSYDTLALVEIPNHIHGFNLRKIVNSKWDVLLTGAWQTQTWQVEFDDNTDEPIYDYERDQRHIRLQNFYHYNDQHTFQFGAMAEREYTKYNVNLPRLAYELLMQSNVDFVESLVYIAPKGMVMLNDGFSQDIYSLTETLYMDYEGDYARFTTGAWFSDNWTLDSNNRVTLGTRIDYETPSRTAFLSPRLSWFHRINPMQEFTLGLGLYAQDNYEFYYRHFNKRLKSEKALHTNVEWSLDITPDYRLELSTYGKFYYDLASAHLVPTGTIEPYKLLEVIYEYFEIDYDSLRALNNGEYVEENLEEIRKAIGDELYNAALNLFGNKTLHYNNSGIGFAYGGEARIHYDPTRIWRGWLSVEASQSQRKDSPSDVWYDFRKHRPWAIKWHNYFDMPGDWEMSLRLEHSAGLPYTGYKIYDNNYGDSDTLFVVEPKNNRDYSAYTRFDIRLEKNWKFFGHPCMTFFEVWNAFNTPNFILTDSKSGQIKFFDMSYPFPIYFTGFEFRW